MKLRRLQITKLPGIDEPFSVEDIGEGLVVVIGPNGIGKSSLCRATRGMLWPDAPDAPRMVAGAQLVAADGQWTVAAEGSHARWQHDGEPSDPPALPPAHSSNCFFLGLRDLIDASPSSGRPLAKQVRQQMAGGFDLDAVADARFADAQRKRAGQSERNAYNSAHQAVRQALQAQNELAERAAQRALLAARADAARLARSRVPEIQSALDCAAHRRKRAGIEAELAGLPAALARASGHELEHLALREEELRRRKEERRKLGEDLVRAQQARQASGLEEPLGSERLGLWRGEIETLRQLDNDIASARAARDEAAAARALQGRRLGVSAEADVPALGADDLDDLFSFLEEAERVGEERRAIEARIALLSRAPLDDDDRTRLERLRENIPHLRAWLRAPDPAGTSTHSVRGTNRGWLIAALSIAAAGGALAALVSPWFVGLAGLGLGWAAALFRAASSPAGSKIDATRETMARQFDTALEAPSRWTDDVVEALLRRLERERDDLGARASSAEEQARERAALEAQRDGLATQEAAIAERRRSLGARLGLSELPGDARMVGMARDIDAFLQARRAEVEAEAALEGAMERHAATLTRLAAGLEAPGGDAPADTTSARARIDALAERDQALRDARAAEQAARTAIERTNAEETRARAEHDAIYHALGVEVDDRRTLEALVDGVEAYRERVKQRDLLTRQSDAIEQQLAGSVHADVLTLDESALESELEDAKENAQQLEDLRGQIARIDSDVDRARSRHDVEEAIASRDASLHALEAARETLLEAAAGEFLIDRVREEHETHQMPKVLERARELFSLFTHHAYDLRVSGNDEDSFVAIEMRSGEGRRPAELSDGTRAQLILAARLAFAEEVEGDEPLPIFLDEALDHSDPWRFDAIVRSLGNMAEAQKRQILYFTNDPTDLARIQHVLAEEGCRPAAIVDLGAIRKQAASVSDAAALQIAPRAPVPAPGNHSAEEYGALLQVPALDVQAGADGQHLFHLLWDALDTLHGLLESRIERVGQWRLLSERGASLAHETDTKLGDGAEGQLDARARLLDEFCAARSAGRGRPVDRDAIEASDAITEKYLDGVCALAAELMGDGVRLLEAMRRPAGALDERLKGMHGRLDRADQLERHLSGSGHLDPSATLSEDEVFARLQAYPAADRFSRQFVAEAAHRWWQLAERHDGGA